MTYITRRHFLKQTALAGLAASGLTASQLFAANATPARRVIFVYFPDGAESGQWHANGDGKQFTLPAMTAPLQRVKQHCVFLNGINMVGSGGTHEGGIIKLLTGRSGQGNDLGVSLDYYLGQLYKNETVTPLLNLNVVPIYTDKHITYDSNGIAVVPQMNPLAAFDSLFGAANSNQAHQRQQVSILDHSLAELKALQKALGSNEKAKLDTHLDAVRQLERKLTAQGPGVCGAWNFNPTGFKVTHTELWQNPEFMDAKQMALIGDLHIDVAVHALSCGLTRVVTLKWNNSVNEKRHVRSGF
ncbi:DUF1552 domain-containing protein [Methylocucumis oryzae]|uniref:DUF1552 domain-containing protein n=1 Tax=Methylocucumis oryzae TaxID=1632867 RepID=UPI000A4D57F0|nr:DUF1552 domain-containing protein [Methylocucumis oryzae]